MFVPAKSLMLFTALAAFGIDSAAAQVRTSAVQVRPTVAPGRPVVAPARPLVAPPRPAVVPAKAAGPAAAQPDAPVPGNPDFAPQAAAAQPAPPPLPPAVWDPVSAQDLVYYIQQVGADGLTPADYDPAGLQAAIRSGDPLAMSKAAT